MNNTKYDWLKWIGILPVSIFTYAVSFYVINLINSITSFFWDGDKFSMFYLLQYLIPLVANCFGAYFYIISGSSLAPNYKKKTGLILFILLLIITLFGIIMSIIRKEYSDLLLAIGTIISSFYAFKSINEMSQINSM